MNKALYLVIQLGGSSGEFYPSFYNTQKAALAAVKGHRKASYDAIGPIEVPVAFQGQPVDGGDPPAYFSEQALIDAVTAVLPN